VSALGQAHGLAPTIVISHDAFFVSAFSDIDVLVDFLKANLDHKILELLDLSKITKINKSFVKSNLNHSCSDLCFKIDVNNKPAFLYLLFEHQSSSNPLMPFRFLEYIEFKTEK
jgi:predicted transposase/invertase (TIGR01784 family)